MEERRLTQEQKIQRGQLKNLALQILLANTTGNTPISDWGAEPIKVAYELAKEFSIHIDELFEVDRRNEE